MKLVILAGGYGSRISSDKNDLPKPLKQIGKMPIIEHIMQYYASYGINDFLISTGYKSKFINDYFIEKYIQPESIYINTNKKIVKPISPPKKIDWNIFLIKSQEEANTVYRLKSIEQYLDEDTFILTYCDILHDININNLLHVHKNNDNLVTLVGVNPQSRYGEISIKDNMVSHFEEKPVIKNYVSSGVFVCSKEIFKYLKDDVNQSFENSVLPILASESKVAVYKHKGFWHPMDNNKELNNLCKLWENGLAPWKV